MPKEKPIKKRPRKALEKEASQPDAPENPSETVTFMAKSTGTGTISVSLNAGKAAQDSRPAPKRNASKPVFPRISQPVIQPEPIPESLNLSAVQAIIEKTLQSEMSTHTPQPVPKPVVAPKKALPKNPEDLSLQELLAWSSEDDLLPSTPPPSKSYAQRYSSRTDYVPPSSIPIPRPPKGPAPQSDSQLMEMGDYQFRPFSFQDPLDNVQSMSRPASVEYGETMRHPVQSPPKPSMVTMKQEVSYNKPTTDPTRTRLKMTNGGNMVDLSGYKDLTKPPEKGDGNTSTLTQDPYTTEMEYTSMSSATTTPQTPSGFMTTPHPEVHEGDMEVYGDYSGNVKTLVQLVGDLPEGVTKQTGAQIIRLTMEAMGISMENVLSDAQQVQSQLLDAVRGNIKKIEEHKTVIRKLDGEIKMNQNKANELSEIIDLFILANATPNMPNMERGESY